jgi:hypothetical protein
MTYDEALSKAVKLLRLSQSSNPNEAALAAGKAQEIIDRYQIESASLNYAQSNGEAKPDEPIKDFVADPLDKGARQVSSWSWRLFLVIAKPNGCKGYRARHGYGELAVVGRPSDVATVRYLYGYLKSEVNRLAARDCAGNGRSWSDNFRNGVVDTIGQRIAAQHAETRQAIRREIEAGALPEDQKRLALVRVEKSIASLEQREETVAAWMKANLSLGHGRSYSVRQCHPSAREAGRQAGREVRFTKAKACIGHSSL